MKLIKEWRCEKGHKEGFVEWLLYRKIGFVGKSLVMLLIFLVIIKFQTDLVFGVRFFIYVFFIGPLLLKLLVWYESSSLKIRFEKYLDEKSSPD